jgi:hypothetical protein
VTAILIDPPPLPIPELAAEPAPLVPLPEERRPRFRRGDFSCPFCKTNIPPLDREEVSVGGWVVMAALLVCCFPLFYIGLLIKDHYRVCAECGSRLP